MENGRVWSGGGGGDGGDGKKWKAGCDPKFERRYRSLGRKAAKRVDAAVDGTVVAEGVRDARDCKGRITAGGTMSHVFARSVGRSYRILCCVSGSSMRLLRAGDHKAVYGKG